MKWLRKFDAIEHPRSAFSYYAQIVGWAVLAGAVLFGLAVAVARIWG